MIYAIMIIFSVISGCLVPYAEKKKKKSKSTILHEKHQKKWDDKYQPIVSIAGFLRYATGLGTDYSYTYIPQFNSIAGRQGIL